MSKNFMTVAVSVLLSAGVAAGIVKAATPSADAATTTTTSYSIDGAAYRTVNLAENDYPDFTYAAESAVDAVVL